MFSMVIGICCGDHWLSHFHRRLSCCRLGHDKMWDDGGAVVVLVLSSLSSGWWMVASMSQQIVVIVVVGVIVAGCWV